MKEKLNNSKLFILASIGLIVLLLVVAIAQIVLINQKNAKLAAQQEEIDVLESQIEYYQNGTEDKSGDYSITEGEGA